MWAVGLGMDGGGCDENGEVNIVGFVILARVLSFDNLGFPSHECV